MKTVSCSLTPSPSIERSMSNAEGRFSARDWLCFGFRPAATSAPEGRADDGTSELGVRCWAFSSRSRGCFGEVGLGVQRILGGRS
jgi:hypothetical protein